MSKISGTIAKDTPSTKAWRGLSPKATRRIIETLKYIALSVWVIVCIFPFYWSFTIALKRPEMLYVLEFFPRHPTLRPFWNALTNPMLFEGFINTMIVTGLATGINVFTSLLAGYAFARIKFRGRKIAFKIMEMTMMVPFVIFFLPTIIVMANFPLVGGNNILGQGGSGFMNRQLVMLGIMLPSAVSVWNIFLLKQFFSTLPNDFGESARIDGASEFRIFVQIYMPLILPALASLALFAIQGGWNNYLWPNVVGQGRFRVLTHAIVDYSFRVPPDPIGGMAMTLIVSFPMIILFLITQKFFMSGLQAGGVKD